MQKAKNIAKMINEPDTKVSSKKTEPLQVKALRRACVARTQGKALATLLRAD